MTEKVSTASQALLDGYFRLYPREAARKLNNLPPDQVMGLLQAKPISNAAAIYVLLSPELASELINLMDGEFFAAVFTQIDPSRAASLLSRVDQKTMKKRLVLLPKMLSRQIQELIDYPAETAGRLMDVRIPTFYPDQTVEEALAKIRTIRDRRVVTLYLVDEDMHLIGIVPLQQAAASDPSDRLGTLLHDKPVTIHAMSPKEDAVRLFEERKLISLPVVDLEGKLLGVIRNEALVTAVHQEAMEDVQAMFGAGREERALSKVSFAIRKRLPWLEVNLATAFLAAAVVGLFEDTIARITALAIFLPVVAGQSGNTGSQALAVTMRGLALREIHMRHWFQVARKEATVGFVNGCVIAVSTAIVAYVWMNSFGLSIVIGVAMVFSMVIAGLSGAIIPIILKALGQDPAQSSSIVLTTVTDVVGFLSFLGLATLFAETLAVG